MKQDGITVLLTLCAGLWMQAVTHTAFGGSWHVLNVNIKCLHPYIGMGLSEGKELLQIKVAVHISAVLCERHCVTKHT